MAYFKGLACLLFLMGVIILIFAVPYFAMAIAVVGIIAAILGAVIGVYSAVSSGFEGMEDHGDTYDQNF